MTRWIALLRGINVGGRNKLPMNDLKAHLSELGAFNIQTYIQSGNIVFSASKLKPDEFTQKLSKAIDSSHGFAPDVLMLERKDLEQAIQKCPFPKDDNSEKILHFYFLSEKPSEIDVKKLDDLKMPSEQWSFSENVFYLYAPDGIGRSKLATKAEVLFGVSTTARNWRTVHNLLQMI